KVLSVAEQEEKHMSIVEIFVEALDLDDYFALVLIEEGIETLDDLAYLDRAELLEMEGFDEESVDVRVACAKAVILSLAVGG
ncbi:transcription termination/antitermination protein NusA, partial [Francisella tularensis subsp. holarctica]|nr:transcription termination/antitermination protein NusA [Francisella tularensis subsp. holarctica]